MSVILYETLDQNQLRACLKYVGCTVDKVEDTDDGVRAEGVRVFAHEDTEVVCKVTLDARDGLCGVHIVTANTPCSDVEGEYVSLANWQCGNVRAAVNTLERSFSQIAYDAFGDVDD